MPAGKWIIQLKKRWEQPRFESLRHAQTLTLPDTKTNEEEGVKRGSYDVQLFNVINSTFSTLDSSAIKTDGVEDRTADVYIWRLSTSWQPKVHALRTDLVAEDQDGCITSYNFFCFIQTLASRSSQSQNWFSPMQMDVRLREPVLKIFLETFEIWTKWGAFGEEKGMTILKKPFGGCHWNGVTTRIYLIHVNWLVSISELGTKNKIITFPTTSRRSQWQKSDNCPGRHQKLQVGQSSKNVTDASLVTNVFKPSNTWNVGTSKMTWKISLSMPTTVPPLLIPGNKGGICDASGTNVRYLLSITQERHSGQATTVKTIVVTLHVLYDQIWRQIATVRLSIRVIRPTTRTFMTGGTERWNVQTN